MNYYESEIESVKDANAFQIFWESAKTKTLSMNAESVQAFVNAFWYSIVSEYYGYDTFTDGNGDVCRVFKKKAVKIGTAVFETEKIHVETKTFFHREAAERFGSERVKELLNLNGSLT